MERRSRNTLIISIIIVNDLEIWEMAKIFGKWLRYIGHG